jgi:hypothetical protein
VETVIGQGKAHFQVLVGEGVLNRERENEFLTFWRNADRKKFPLDTDLCYLKGTGVSCCDTVKRTGYLALIKKVNNKLPSTWTSFEKQVA